MFEILYRKVEITLIIVRCQYHRCWLPGASLTNKEQSNNFRSRKMTLSPRKVWYLSLYWPNEWYYIVIAFCVTRYKMLGPWHNRKPLFQWYLPTHYLEWKLIFLLIFVRKCLICSKVSICWGRGRTPIRRQAITSTNGDDIGHQRRYASVGINMLTTEIVI